jgi:hypothetical protein
MKIFCCCCFANKSKTTHGKNKNKNTDLFINYMDFVVVRTKINKNKIVIFFRMLGPCSYLTDRASNNTSAALTIQKPRSTQRPTY